jgi:hypothetical protein
MSQYLGYTSSLQQTPKHKTPGNERYIRTYYHAGIAAQAQKFSVPKGNSFVIIFSALSSLTLLTYCYEQWDIILFCKSCNLR